MSSNMTNGLRNIDKAIPPKNVEKIYEEFIKAISEKH